MPEKLDRCVDKVKGQNGVDNAYAICNANLNEANVKPFPPFDTNTTETHNPMDIPFGKEIPGGDDPDPLDKIEKEAVAIGGGLSAQSIGGKRHEDQKLEECQPCQAFDHVHMALMQEADEDTEWITVKGAHIPIKKGENKGEVVKAFLAGKGGGTKAKGTTLSSQSEKELVSSIKAGSKSWKDWGRKESNEKEYAEIERRNREIPKPKRPEGAGGSIFQDDPNAISKYETKIKYLEDVGDYWKKIIKFPARDYHHGTQLGDAKWYEMSNNSSTLRDTKKKLEKVKERKEAGTTLERKTTYKGGKPRFYYKEKPKEGTSETIDSNPIFDNVLNALRKEAI